MVDLRLRRGQEPLRVDGVVLQSPARQPVQQVLRASHEGRQQRAVLGDRQLEEVRRVARPQHLDPKRHLPLPISQQRGERGVRDAVERQCRHLGVQHIGVDIEFPVFEHRVRLRVREEPRPDVVRVHRRHLEEESHASRQRRHRVVRGEVGG